NENTTQSGNQTFSYSVASNTSTQSRTATITLTTGDITRTHTLTQTETSFEIVEGNFTWEQAKADAEARGGRLAVLNTQEKIDAANSYLATFDREVQPWIGLTDEEIEGVWKWITGEVLTNNRAWWIPTEPDNDRNADHAYITNRAFLWGDHPRIPLGEYLLETNSETTLSDGLVAYYPFNGNAEDASGNNRHLSTQGQPTFEEGTNGLLSAQFDDNADGFEILGQDTPENIGAASVSVWFEQDDPSGSQVVVGLTRPSTSRFIIYLEDGAIR
ncbi:MAG: hypothetical protein GY917_10170, partial [Planctomycetaceae bacterium]|nr:hypothetical protein [Planctomycetaceae bacterium]